MEKVVIYTYRYTFVKVDDADGVINVKIISDTVAGHDALIVSLKADETIKQCAREYLHEYDVSQLGFIESLKPLSADSKPISDSSEVK